MRHRSTTSRSKTLWTLTPALLEALLDGARLLAALARTPCGTRPTPRRTSPPARPRVEERVGGALQPVERRVGHPVPGAAGAQVAREPVREDARGEEPKAVREALPHRRPGLRPRAREELDEAVEDARVALAEGLDVGRALEEAPHDAREVAVVARLGQEAARDAVRELRRESRARPGSPSRRRAPWCPSRRGAPRARRGSAPSRSGSAFRASTSGMRLGRLREDEARGPHEADERVGRGRRPLRPRRTRRGAPPPPGARAGPRPTSSGAPSGPASRRPSACRRRRGRSERWPRTSARP